MALTRPAVTVIAPRGDRHAAAVLAALARHGCAGFQVDVTRDLGTTAVVRRHPCTPPKVRLEGVPDGTGAFWLRRFGPPADRDALVRANRQALLTGLAQVYPEARWVNPLAAVLAHDLGAGKLRQLCEARHYLRVPETCVTNEPEEARRFAADHPRLVSKALVSTADRPVYTAEVASDADWARIRACPVVLQEQVPKAFEVRVVTCGRRHLATRIWSQDSAAARVDFRLDPGVRHEPYELPPIVADALERILSKLDLAMGVSDLVVTPEGQHVYLETNQQGQWLWLQDRTGVDHAGFVAEFLAALAVGRPW